MNNLTPSIVRMIESYSDGDDSIHCTLELPKRLRETSIAPGQFLMLSLPGKGEAPFTYVIPPDDKGFFDILIRKTGKLTSEIYNTRPEFLGYRGPFGVGWPVKELSNSKVLIIAGGCGLAPIASFVNHRILHRQQDNTVVIYGARQPSTTILERERQYWYSEVRFIETLERYNVSANLPQTPLDKIEQGVELLNGTPDAIVACGPHAMLRNVVNKSKEMQISNNKIFLSIERRMHCGDGTCGHCYLGYKYCCRDGPTFNWQELLELGVSESFI